ncbi:unnamed protein product [Microthlaspi erraticum]|uniref:U-box domain-containing protein n=1 Tax=Microthlaspi erraticum TaxID=1685480 RepID=A0A6D2JA93_9BRAS|nr:unnamed protein product [Microthlaspi erraticum]
MAESTTGDATKDRSDTNGSFNALKSIDESIGILNRLREAESKKPESEISSSSPAPVPKFPDEFRCSLSTNIMIEPVVIASGQTFEKRYITEWLISKQTCPKTFEVLSHLEDQILAAKELRRQSKLFGSVMAFFAPEIPSLSCSVRSLLLVLWLTRIPEASEEYHHNIAQHLEAGAEQDNSC